MQMSIHRDWLNKATDYYSALGGKKKNRYERDDLSLSPPCEIQDEDGWSAKKEECPHQTMDLPTSWSWISQPPELYEINFCSLSHSCLWYSVIATQTD